MILEFFVTPHYKHQIYDDNSELSDNGWNWMSGQCVGICSLMYVQICSLGKRYDSNMDGSLEWGT